MTDAPHARREQKRKWISFSQPRFQAGFVGFVSLLQIGIVAGLTARVYAFFRDLERIADSIGLSEAHPFRGFLALHQRSLLLEIGLYGLGLVLGAAVLAFIFSFRYTGPIQRITGYLEEVAEKKEVERPLQIRESDFLSPIARAMNAAFDAVKRNG